MNNGGLIMTKCMNITIYTDEKRETIAKYSEEGLRKVK